MEIKLTKETKVKLLKAVQFGTFNPEDFPELTLAPKFDIKVYDTGVPIATSEDDIQP